MAAKAQGQEKATDEDLIKVLEDALATLRNMHGARLAIF